MEVIQYDNSVEEQEVSEGEISHVLSYPPIIYFLGLFLGLAVDMVVDVKIFNENIFFPVGFSIIILASLLIFWAQKTSFTRYIAKGSVTKKFHKGPYRFSRHPSTLGIGLMVVGFGFLVNSIFVVLTAPISFIFIYYFFTRREEALLERKYGDGYSDYKKSVRRWI